MSDHTDGTSASTTQVEAANAYEEFFVPALFREWAPRVADAAGIGAGQRVLDVACGTGVLTREVRARVGDQGTATGLDLNPGMLAVARRVSPGIEWRQGSAEALPFADASFDAVVSQFGLMFFPDRERALHEMQRVLVPGGRLAVAVWDSLDNTPFYAAEGELVGRIAGRDAADALNLPFALGEPGKLGAIFASAGIPDAEIRPHPGTARFPSLRSAIEVDLRGWLPLVGIVVPEEKIARILSEAETVMRPYFRTTPTGITFDSPALIATATR